MNFLLNKIDTDLRRKNFEETRDGKVHSKSEVLINKDAEKSRDKTFDKCLEKELKEMKKRKDSKKEGEIIQVEYAVDLNVVTEYCGNFLDIKK